VFRGTEGTPLCARHRQELCERYDWRVREITLDVKSDPAKLAAYKAQEACVTPLFRASGYGMITSARVSRVLKRSYSNSFALTLPGCLLPRCWESVHVIRRRNARDDSGTRVGCFVRDGTVVLTRIPKTGNSIPVVGRQTALWTESSVPPPSTVPEPSAVMLLGTGMLGLIGMIRRKPSANC
jgi:hypothetical protein